MTTGTNIATRPPLFATPERPHTCAPIGRVLTALLLAILLAGCSAGDDLAGAGGGSSADTSGGGPADAGAGAMDTSTSSDTASAADSGGSGADTAGADAGPVTPHPDCPTGTQEDTEGTCRPVAPVDQGSFDQCALPDDLVDPLYVDAAAAPEGADGSPGAPFPTLSQALEEADAGATIVLGKGTYPGALAVRTPVMIVGSCAKEVVLTAPPGAAVLSVELTGDVRIEGITLVGGAVGLRSVESPNLHVHRVAIAGSRRGMELVGGSALVTASRIHDMAPKSAPASLGPSHAAPAFRRPPRPLGIGVYDEAVVTVAATVVQNAGAFGVFATQSTVFLLGDSEVRDSRVHNVVLSESWALVEGTRVEWTAEAEVLDTFGCGIVVHASASAIVRDNQILGAKGAAISLRASGAPLVEDNTIHDCRRGIEVTAGDYQTVVRGNSIEGSAEAAIAAWGSPVVVGPGNDIDGVLAPTKAGGAGIVLVDSPLFDIVGNTVRATAGTGITLHGSSGTVQTNDLADAQGSCLWVQGSSRVTAKGNTLSGCYGAGLAAIDSELDAQSNTVSNIAEAPGGVADGILVSNAAARIESNLLPIPIGIIPNPMRAGILVNAPKLAISDLLGLNAGVAVTVSGNTVEAATYGVVVQGETATNGVTVGANTIGDGVGTKLAEEPGLEVHDSPVTLPDEPPRTLGIGQLPIPIGI